MTQIPPMLQLFLEKSKLDRKKYQLDGILWCIQRELTKQSPKGGFVFDEMGLGKTIMMIATIVSNYQSRTLIVLPNALLDQWKQEIFRTTGIRIVMFHGNAKKNVTRQILENSDIILTTYNTVITSELLREVHWNRVIFDEAHHLRNGPKTKRYTACFELKANIRWLMTGTPIQNKSTDFAHLCKLLRIPIHDGFQHILQHFVLKRTKKEVGLVLKDVEHTEKHIMWKNSTEQKVARELQRNFASRTSNSLLRTILRARQMCVLPTILQSQLPMMIDTGELVDEYSKDDAPLGTSKMDVVMETILNEKRDVGKLIFCHFRKEMDTIAERLLSKNITNIYILDGRIKQKERERALKEKYDVLILQIQTCCEGLNLQENYSQIYFVAPTWNPSVEEQAIARCHRYGQENTVKVFRFYMDNSMDKYILSIQNNKRDIVEKVFQIADID